MYKDVSLKNSLLIKNIQKNIKSVFGDDFLFAFIFGSRARLEYHPSSDIDLVIVFKESLYPKKKIDLFKKYLIQVQKSLKMKPDFDYPGEYLSENDLSDAIKGYGFVFDKNKIEIPYLSSKDWNHFFDFRQWLCAIGGVTRFLDGNYDKYLSAKKLAQRNLLILHLLTINEDNFNPPLILDSLLSRGKRYLGFCNTPATKRYLTNFIKDSLDTLEKDKIIEKSQENKYKLLRKNAIEQLPLLTNKEEYSVRKDFVGSLTTQKDKNLFIRTLNLGLDFILEEDKPLKYYTPQEIQKRFSESIPIKGISTNKILEEFEEKIADGAIHQSATSYLAFPDSGNSIAGLQASILMNFLNQNLISFEKSSPTGTFVEMEVIRWLRNLIGYPKSEELPKNIFDVGGMGTTGGTMSNTIAILLARCKAFPQSRKFGLSNSQKKPILFISDTTLNHYSHNSSWWWLGMGENNIVRIKADDSYRIDLKDLENKLKKYSNDKTKKIVALIILAGDSRTTQIDRLQEIANITRNYNVWLHIDACHGGILLFSRKYRNKLNGIEQADSVSLDPHKGLGIPYSSSFILFKDPEDAKLISQSSDITISDKHFDLGQFSPFLGSKPFDSLKLWFLIKNLGINKISNLIDYRLDLSKEWYNTVMKSRFFMNMTSVNLNSVVFSVSPKKVNLLYPKLELDSSLLNRINTKIHDEVYKEGYICIHNFDLYDLDRQLFSKKQKIKALGVIFGNPYITKFKFHDYLIYLDKKVENILNAL